jgi:hypothetical protein
MIITLITALVEVILALVAAASSFSEKPRVRPGSCNWRICPRNLRRPGPGENQRSTDRVFDPETGALWRELK